MVTKFTTGQAILIPAKIISAREENGVILYNVEPQWGDIPEEAITVDEQAAAQGAFNRAMEKLSRDIPERYW